jgi:hypothetical protein
MRFDHAIILDADSEAQVVRDDCAKLTTRTRCAHQPHLAPSMITEGSDNLLGSRCLSVSALKSGTTPCVDVFTTSNKIRVRNHPLAYNPRACLTPYVGRSVGHIILYYSTRSHSTLYLFSHVPARAKNRLRLKQIYVSTIVAYVKRCLLSTDLQ